MRQIGVLNNIIKEYAWGSKKAIPELLGQKVPAAKPQAELWMGAHPKGPSQVLYNGFSRSLLELIEENPEEILGKKVAKKFSGKLPFLFKVLAATKPLSIQAHPNSGQAINGFRRENEQGIPLDAANRNYRDDNHKPEIICALTPFWALNGFRKVSEILELVEKTQAPILLETLRCLRDRPNQEGLKQFFSHLMSMEVKKQAKIVEEAVGFAEKQADVDPVWLWVMRLNQEYPNDIGVISPTFLNLVQLEPQQAMYLPAGELHAYLKGVGIELMANSDNVLRGGLTPKHADLQELLKILNFSGGEVDILKPKRLASGEGVYPTEAAEFVLSVIEVGVTTPFGSAPNRSVEIVICTKGEARITDLSDGAITLLTKGSSIVVPAAVEQYSIEGEATLYKAAVPG